MRMVCAFHDLSSVEVVIFGVVVISLYFFRNVFSMSINGW